MLDEIRSYISMSDRLILYPHDKVSISVWDIEDDRSVGVLEGHTSTVCAVFINNKGTMAVTLQKDQNGEDDYPVKIWNLGTMQCTASLSPTMCCSAIMEDRFILGSMEGPITVWDIGSSTPVELMDLHEHSETIWSIAASDSSNIALSGSNDETVRLWDLRTGQCVRVMEGHTDAVQSVSMDSACRTAVSGSDDGTVKLWDLDSGRCINTYQHDQRVRNVMMHESGGSFLSVGYGLSIKAWATALGFDRPILDADLSGLHLCNSESLPFGSASRDLSKVAICHNRVDGVGLGVRVWK